MSDALLSVRDLSVEFSTYGRTSKVLHNVSLDVPAHSQVALVGESGSGKTVTMKAIMGLLREPPARITNGRILYDGSDLLTMPASERLKLRGTAMSMVFQDPMSSLNPVFTIADQMSTILKAESVWRACMKCSSRCGCAIPSGFPLPIPSSFPAACGNAS